MENEEIFNLDDYKNIANLIEEKMSILRKNEDFNEKYLRLTNMIENLGNKLDENKKEEFEEIVKLFYETEQYYFILSYSLGVKYGDMLNKL